MSWLRRRRRWPGSAGTAPGILAPVRRIGRRLRRRRATGTAGAATGRRGRSGTCTGASVVRGSLCQLPAGGGATPKSTRVASAPVDLGITGRRAAVAAASAGWPGCAWRCCARASTSPSAAATPSGSLGRSPAWRPTPGPGPRSRARSTATSPAKYGHGGGRGAGRSTSCDQRRQGRPRARSPRPISTPAPAGAQPAVDGGDAPGRGAGHGRAGAGGGDHLDHGAPARGHADPVQHGAGGRHRAPEDPRHRRWRRAATRTRCSRACTPPTSSCSCTGATCRAGAALPVVAGDPDDFGARWPALCSEPAGFITGTALQIDGGAFPGLLDRRSDDGTTACRDVPLPLPT